MGDRAFYTFVVYKKINVTVKKQQHLGWFDVTSVEEAARRLERISTFIQTVKVQAAITR